MNQPDRAFVDERDRLLTECRLLLDAIARQPYCLKRLRAVRAGLEMVRGYKARGCQLPPRSGRGDAAW